MMTCSLPMACAKSCAACPCRRSGGSSPAASRMPRLSQGPGSAASGHLSSLSAADHQKVGVHQARFELPPDGNVADAAPRWCAPESPVISAASTCSSPLGAKLWPSPASAPICGGPVIQLAAGPECRRRRQPPQTPRRCASASSPALMRWPCQQPCSGASAVSIWPNSASIAAPCPLIEPARRRIASCRRHCRPAASRSPAIPGLGRWPRSRPSSISSASAANLGRARDQTGPPDCAAAPSGRRGAAIARRNHQDLPQPAAPPADWNSGAPAAVVDHDLEAFQLRRDAPRQVAIRRDDADRFAIGQRLPRRQRDGAGFLVLVASANDREAFAGDADFKLASGAGRARAPCPWSAPAHG